MSEPIYASNVDAKLSANKFYVDEETAHIELVDDPSTEEFNKLVLACPASLYRYGENGEKLFDYAGCLECGTCRVICGNTIIKKWQYPLGTLGVEYRWG